MLKITVHDGEQIVRLQVEGTLIGDWVNELDASWGAASGGLKGRSLCVDLTGTTRVDAAGCRLLSLMHENRARFTASGPSMRALIAEITGDGSSSSYGERSGEMSITVKENGIVDTPSSHSVNETVEKLKGILQAKGVTLFALVDHSGEAEKVGMKMRPTKLLIFGSPKAGTPPMLAAPSIAIDLPLKILVWEDGQGKVWLSYNSPEYLKERHGLPQDLLQNIAVVQTLAAKAGE